MDINPLGSLFPSFGKGELNLARNHIITDFKPTGSYTARAAFPAHSSAPA